MTTEEVTKEYDADATSGWNAFNSDHSRSLASELLYKAEFCKHAMAIEVARLRRENSTLRNSVSEAIESTKTATEQLKAMSRALDYSKELP